MTAVIHWLATAAVTVAALPDADTCQAWVAHVQQAGWAAWAVCI